MSFRILVAEGKTHDEAGELSRHPSVLGATWSLCLGLLVACLAFANPVAAVQQAVPKYNPNGSEPIQVWRSIITSAPSARGDHTAVWTGSEMIVW